MRRTLLLSALLFLARDAAAGTIVWEAFGEITSLNYAPFHGGRIGPPVGTPYTLRLTFDPAAAMATPTGGASNPLCSTTSVSLTMDLGGFSYTGGGHVYTNALMPATNCYTAGVLREPGSTEFFLGLSSTDPGAWRLHEEPRYLSLLYWDAFHQAGTMATTPVPIGAGWMHFDSDFFNFSAPFRPALHGGEPTATVPEPGTMALVGVGLALAHRHRRRKHF